MSNPLDVNAVSQYVNLLTFNWAAGNAQYVTSDRPYAGGFAAAPEISINFDKQGGGVDDVPITILMPVLDPVASMLTGYPFATTTVLVEEVDITDASTRRTLFKGNISQCTGNKNGNSAMCEIKVAGWKSLLAFPLGIQCTNTCAWKFGDANCKIDASAIAETVTIAGISGNQITIGALSNGTKFERGYVTVNGVSLLIRTQISTTVLELVNTPPPAWSGASAVITPGCRKTMADCTGKWANLINFGGFGISIPMFHPNTEFQ